jgi:hypothetical protein
MSISRTISRWILPLLLAVCFFASPASSVAQTNMPTIPGMGAMAQIELTNDIAKNAIDSYIALKEEYGDDNIGQIDPNSPTAAFQGMMALQGTNAIVSQYGFADISDWHLALRSVIIAYSFLEEGRMEEYEQSIAQMQQQNLPEPMGSQMLAMLQSLKPSDNNLAILTGLAADAEYGPKLISAQN